MLKYLLLYPAEILAYLAMAALLLRQRVPVALAGLAAGISILALAARALFLPPEGWDFEIFWSAGRDIWQQHDPYLAPGLVNPPTSLPLFALFGLGSFETSLALWTALNTLISISLVWLAHRALRAQAGAEGWDVPFWALAVLTAIFANCYANRFGINAGQLSLFTSLVIILALSAQGRGRWLWAGILLALGSIKTATLIPFLLLFLGKKDWKSWIAMGLAGLALALLCVPPGDLLERCRECLHNIGEFAKPGRQNDFAYENRVSHHIQSLGHLFYRLGFRDRTLIETAQFTALGLLAAWILWLTYGPKPLSRPAACAVVACYSGLFLYHRYYDMSILALPLVYAAGRSLTEQSWSRRLFVVTCLSLLAVLFFRHDVMEYFARRAEQTGGVGGKMIEMIVLPCADWALLLTMFSCAWGERLRRRPPVFQAGNP